MVYWKETRSWRRETEEFEGWFYHFPGCTTLQALGFAASPVKGGANDKSHAKLLCRSRYIANVSAFYLLFLLF